MEGTEASLQRDAEPGQRSSEDGDALGPGRPQGVGGSVAGPSSPGGERWDRAEQASTGLTLSHFSLV